MKKKSRKGEKHKKGKDRKPHVFKTKNANGKNNTRPIKYGERFVLKQLRDMLRGLKDDRPILGMHSIIFKSQLFADKPYTEKKFSQWAGKFPNNKKIMDAIDKINEILKGRAWVGGLMGGLNASITKFHLINNYGAKDSVDITGNMHHTGLMREIIKKSKDVHE